LESHNPLPNTSLSEPAEVLLAKLLDPDSQARVPRVFSGSRSLRLSDILDRAIAILHRQQPATRFVVFSPGHPEGILSGLAEAVEVLYPELTRRRLRQLPGTGWPGAIQRAMMADDRPVSRVLVVDPLEELWEPHVSEKDRTQFIHHLTTIANFQATCVLFVIDAGKLEHCQRSRLLQASLISRFHLRLGGMAPVPRVSPPPVPTGELLPLQPIRPRQMRPFLRDQRAHLELPAPQTAPSPA
jgi:hypothetical protein